MAHSQTAKEPEEEFLNTLFSLGYRIVKKIFLEFVPEGPREVGNVFLEVVDSLVGETTKNTQSSHHHSTVQVAKNINSHSPMKTTPRSPTVSPLLGNTVVSSTCDHNGGIVSSAKDGIKVIIPKGTTKEGDSVTFSIAASLCGPFVLPSRCQADLASPYYWIGVTESYHFKKPVRVKFEHYGACVPSHYQLLTCEDDDVSYTMRPVDYELSFEVEDDVSLCTFQTNHFCSYCLFHCCKDPNINRIGAYYLKPENFQILDQFRVEIWFSFPISHCLKRNEELYSRKGMILDTSCVFEASSDKDSTSYFGLKYDRYVEGWCVDHLRSIEVQTKDINFFNLYTNVEDLFAHEENALFPPRFIINVIKQPEYTADLNINIEVSLSKAEGRKSVDSAMFKLFVPVSAMTMRTSSRNIDHHYCDKNKPTLEELLKFSSKISMYWKKIACILGISLDRIDRVEHNCQTSADKVCDMFSVWLHTRKSPCWCHFISALYEVGLNEVAEQAKLCLESSYGAVASPAMTEDSLKNKEYTLEHVPNLYELERLLKDIPNDDLNFFTICLLPKESSIQVIKQIRRSNGSKEDNMNKIWRAFLKERDPSWTKVHKALKEADCDDLAELVEACFLPL